jgi:hypothetical protein
MNKFLDTYNHPKLNQEDINHINGSTTHKEIEAAIKSLSRKKSPGPDRFYAKFYQTFKQELISTFLKLSHKIEREVTLSNSFYEASVTLISKLDKDTYKNKNCRPISLMSIDAKILSKIMEPESNNILERSHIMTNLDSFQGCTDGSTYANH